MKDQKKTKAQLIKELEDMRVRVSEMETSEAEHERAEEKIRHLNAVLRAIRNVNQLITKEKDLGRLLHGICDNLVKNRGYHNVWIAFLDEHKGLVATAEAGLGEAFHPIAQRLKRGMFMGCGQKALVRKGVVITEDPFSECVDCPLAAKYGGRGAMTVCLEFERSVYGLLAVSVPKDVAVDKEEQVLFKEVAEDIAFALHNIELEEGRKLAGESIRLAAAYARNLIETSLDPLVTIDEEGKITDVNAAAEEITGYSRKKLIGTKFSAYFTDPEKVEAGQQEAFSQGSVRDYELEVRHRDGHVTPVLHNASVYRDETGRIAGVVAAARDVTEWKKAEAALKESEARYRALFETSVDGILVAEKKTKKFIYANPAICGMLGYTEEELTQISVHDIHPKESLEYVLAEFETQAKGERSLSRDMPCLRSDGTIFYADVNAGESVLDGKECSIGFFRDDITDRKKAEEALRDSEELFRTLFETAPIGLVFSRPSDGTIVGCNQRAAELLGGSSPKEFVGRKTADFYASSRERSRVITALDEHGSFKDMEIAFKALDGREFLGLFSGTMTKYGGKPVILAVVVDITERKEAEEALRESEELFRTLFETAPIGLFLTRPSDGTVFSCNQKAAEVFGGSSPKDFIGIKTIGQYVNPEDRSHMVATLKEHGYFRDMEVAFKTLDGRPLLILFSGIMARYSGEPVLLSVVVDITDRKKAEDALKESEGLFRTMFETAPIGLVLTRIPEGTVIACNQKIAEMFGGSSPDEITGRNAVDFYVSSEDRSRVVGVMREHGVFKDFEIAFKTLSGRQFWGLSCGAMTRYGGQPVLLSGIADITDRKKAEEALQKARNELESRVEERTSDLVEVNRQLMREIKERIRVEEALKNSIAEKEILIREIHHRVKNNLQVISSLLDMGNMRITDASQAHEMFKEAGAIIQAMALIHSMLYGARKFESVNIAEFVRKLYVQLAQMYVGQSKKITPEFHLEDVHLSIDKAVPLGLVLNEILANVFKHAFPGDDSGKVEIHLRKDYTNTVFLSFSDNGIGIPEKIDVEAANSMGLKLIRIIVREQLRGELSVERERGTTISMEFIALRAGDSNDRANA